MWLQTRMFLLIAALFGILYGVITAVGTCMGAGGFVFYIVLAFVILGLQYWLGPKIVSWTMKVRWVSESQAPQLHRMVAEPAAFLLYFITNLLVLYGSRCRPHDGGPEHPPQHAKAHQTPVRPLLTSIASARLTVAARLDTLGSTSREACC